jgi:membrane protein required for colicin V production
MNWLDVLLALIVAVSVYASFRKGLSREVIGLVSVVLALLLGIWFYGTASAFIQPHVSSRTVANLVGFLVVFVGVVLLGHLVGYIVGKFLRVTGLSIFDHLLGAGFGAARGALIAVAVLMAMMAFRDGDKPPAAVVNSRLAPYVAGAAQVFADVAPHELKVGFRKTYAEVKSAWKTAVEEQLHGGPRAEKRNR